MTTTPLVLHVVRPYASTDEYIAAESWTLDARNMLLIGEPELPADTAIVFDVTLGDGSRPIKAEARVLGRTEPRDGRPGGLRVRFKRYGAPTKSFIDRVLAFVASEAARSPATLPEPPPAEPSSPGPSVTSSVDASAPGEAFAQPEPATGARDAAAEAGPASFQPVPATPSGRPDGSALLARLRQRGAQMPETPGNREYLLEKLRQRGQGDDVTMRFQRA